MAQKRSFGNEEQFTGYIAETSPLKQMRDGKSHYFTATFQMQNSECKRIICFDESKHSTFETMDTQGTPVKLNKVSLVPSLNKETTDIKVSRFSQVRGLNADSILFKRRKLENTSQPGPVTAIADVQNCSDDITIIVKVVDIFETTTEEIFHRFVDKQVISVADKTGQITLSLFGPLVNAVKIAESYNISNVQVRNYKEMTLTTTSRTAITPCTDIGTFKSVAVEAPSFTGTVKQIAITLVHKCPACRKPITRTGEKFTRCASCAMKSLTSDLSVTVAIKINVHMENELKRLSVTQKALETFLCEKRVQSNLTNSADIENIEEFLLCLPIKMSLQKDLVTSISSYDTTSSDQASSTPSEIEASEIPTSS